MDEDIFNQDELTPDDLAVLQAFDAMDLNALAAHEPAKEQAIPETPRDHLVQQASPSGAEDLPTGDLLFPDEMLATFIGEVDQDLATLRRVLQQLDPGEHLDPAYLQVIQRIAHKLKGTCGAIGCPLLARIAGHMETLATMMAAETIAPFVGLQALLQTFHALQATLNSLATTGEESQQPLTELEAEYQALNIDIQDSAPPPASASSIPVPKQGQGRPGEALSLPPFVRVDTHRLAQLMQDSQQLAESDNTLVQAQSTVEKALQELQAAQERLQRLERSYTHFVTAHPHHLAGQPENGERPLSSLVARILDESAERTGHFLQRKSTLQQRSLKSKDMLSWDELELDRFTEDSVLLQSLREAVTDVATTTSMVRTAFAQLARILQQHIAQVSKVRDDSLLLRLTPISTLLPHIERAVMMSTLAREQEVQFEVQGESTEIDQDILEELKQPLLQLIRTCITTAYPLASTDEERHEPGRIWLHVQASGNEVNIELGFSMPVNGGALHEVQAALRRSGGSLTTTMNKTGGISFYLRFPRSHGPLRVLLLHIDEHHVAVPFSQVQRIIGIEEYRQDQDNQARAVPLQQLLGLSAGTALPEQPVYLVLSQENHEMRAGRKPLIIGVDEILASAELVVKPLPTYLRRPGITGTAIDGTGNVLLILDVPELVRQYSMQQHSTKPITRLREAAQPYRTAPKQHTVLIADDSLSMRQSLRQALSHYRVLEARNGLEALEMLLDHLPDALILDLEMPNLNGYDLLAMMHMYPELAGVKIVMLTSRSSEKHEVRTRELGAHAYLTKPCSPETLLETLQNVLGSDHPSSTTGTATGASGRPASC